MTKKLLTSLGLFGLAIVAFVYSQIAYPFLDSEGNRDMQAYWYNLPRAEVQRGGGETSIIQSAFHIYGQAPADDFQVNVKVFLRNNKKAYENLFEIKKAVKLPNVEIRNGFFKIAQPVEYLPEKPERIVMTLKSEKGKRTKDIICRYHKLSGKITDFDGQPVKAYVAVCPDSFAGDLTWKWADDRGNYEIWLPERTYNAIIANTEQYGATRLEAWGWHVIMDSDQTIDFKIGNAEVYNLHVWTNNGGGRNYFISFRPMALLFKDKTKNYPVNLSGREIPIVDMAPELDPKDIKVKVNGQDMEFISLQKFYETQGPDHGMPDYLVQVLRKGPASFGKQTVVVEYDKYVEMDGKKNRISSLGLCQFYLNYNGQSEYF